MILYKLLHGHILRRVKVRNAVETFSFGNRLNFFSSTTATSCFSKGHVKLDDETISLLEKLSLVNFESKQYVSVVEQAISFAEGINSVNTDNVEPLISLLENENLRLRDDVLNDGNCREEILRNAALVEDEYFVAPPGNIPINPNIVKESS